MWKVQVIETKEWPDCPICGAQMRLMRKMIANVKSIYDARVTQWWGCTQYPKCKGYLNIDEARRMLHKREQDKRKRVINTERRKQAMEGIRATLSKRGHINYYQYINSPEWKQKAEEAKRRARYRCQVCNRSSWEVVLNTHHRTYERLGYEMEEDLVVLCDNCHKTFHKNGKVASYKRQHA